MSEQHITQQLWDFVYDLLPPEEAAQIQSQIDSDPDVARQHQQVRQQAELIAQAARFEQPPIPLPDLVTEETSGGNHSPSKPVQKTQGKQASRWSQRGRPGSLSRVIGALTLTAAAVLVLLAGHAYFRPDSLIRWSAVHQQQQRLAQQFVRTVVTGPDRLQSGTDGSYQVTTTLPDGTPASQDIEYRLYDSQGELRLDRRAKTNEEGKLTIQLTSAVLSVGGRLEVQANPPSENQKPIVFTSHLRIDPPRYVTHLSLDKPLYRPGETVYYRSLTLSRFGLETVRPHHIAYSLLSPSGAPVSHSQQIGATDHGVGNGAFTLPPHIIGGKYTLVAQNPQGVFPEMKKEFFVRDYRTPRLKKKLEFARDSYGPGDTVIADFSVERATGGAVAGAKLEMQATVDGQAVKLKTSKATVDQAGAYQVKFALPQKIEKGAGMLAVVVDDGGSRETIAKTIPINVGKVEVKFYPEGGDLAPGLANRVYFHAHDPLGEPAHIQGKIVDEQGRKLTEVETGHEGRGVFTFVPKSAEVYHLRITHPVNVNEKAKLPAASFKQKVTLNTGAGVFEAGKPIELDLHSSQDASLVVAAVCRGVQVGQQSIVLKRKGAPSTTQQVVLPLTKEAEGVIRLTVYDYGVAPPRPLAERLVYRRPERKLEVRVADHQEGYSPGEKVKLSLKVRDENGAPAPAALGVKVVDDTVLNLADDKSPRMTTNFRLASEIEKPQDLEDANFFLEPTKKSAQALDLLLGTQGWRRFVERSAAELLAQRTTSAQPSAKPQSGDSSNDSVERLLVLDGAAAAPVVHDNHNQVQRRYERALALFHSHREGVVRNMGRLALVVGLALLLFVALAAPLRLISGVRVWGPALAVAVGSIFLGGAWLAARIAPPSQQTLAFSSFGDSLQQPTGAGEPTRGELTLMAEARPGRGGDPQQRRRLGRTFQFYGRALYEDGLQWKKGNKNHWGLGMADNGRFDGYALADFANWNRFAGPRVKFNAGKQPQALFIQPYFTPMDRANRFRGGMAGGMGGMGGGGFGYAEGFGNAAAYSEFSISPDGSSISAHDFWKKAPLLEWDMRQAAIDGKVDKVLSLTKTLDLGYQLTRLPIRQYAHQHKPAKDPNLRRDFQETLFWHPLLIADKTGSASIEFDLSDAVTSFRVSADAHHDGRIGVGDGEIISRIPFSLSPKQPLEVTAGDRIELPLAISNETKDKLPVEVQLAPSDLLRLEGEAARKVEVAAGKRRRELFPLTVVGEKGEAAIEFRGKAGHLTDAVRKTIRVVPPGFPVSQSYAGRIKGEHKFVVELPPTWVAGSLEATLQAFPSSLSELRQGVAGMLREPSGCFEQTSSSNYPNILVLRYMQEHDIADPDFTSRAKSLLEKGYGKLVSFECSQKGYEWFGGNPGHEALTAYGLMEFHDMKHVWDVDREMLTRTAKWLMNRRDGQGGFERNAKALDSFGRAPQGITNAYITWALSEAQQPNLDAEIEHVMAAGQKTEDPYVIALAAMAALNTGREEEGHRLLDKLATLQQSDGAVKPAKTTITRSGGISAKVEATALAALAWLKDPQKAGQATKAIQWITSSRQGSGAFGSTQATVLALKALVAYAQAHRRNINAGELILEREGEVIGRTAVAARQRKIVTLTSIAQMLKPGKNSLTVRLTGDNEMPFVLDVRYRTRKPLSNEECPLRLKTTLAEDRVKFGKTVSLAVKLENTSGEGQPMSVAIVGLPAGLEASTEQLEKLKKADNFDYYEIRGRELVFYWRSLGPDVKDQQAVEFTLDLVAEIPGWYAGPASRAYLYYTAEHKHWVEPLRVEIEP